MKYLKRIKRQLELKDTQIGLHIETVEAMVMEAVDLDDQESKLLLQIFGDKLHSAHEHLQKKILEQVRDGE